MPYTDASTEFFDELGRRGYEPLLHAATGTVRVDLEQGGKTDRWFVAIDRGTVSVSRRNVRADCVLRLARELFDDLARGEGNGLAAVLRGEVAVEGNLELILFFQRLFPGPAGAGRDSVGDGKAGG